MDIQVAGPSNLRTPGTKMNILELPHELLEEILSYLTYDQVAQIRQVNRHFNRTCGRLLNRGFTRVEKHHNSCMKRFKAQLPRRESERRTHPLARHCDVLSSIETRLSLLNMTYMKYVDHNLCCFIPGKVLDEIYRVLRVVNGSAHPPRVHELLQELRDISSMAMEYFEEKIAPKLKSKLNPRGLLGVTAAPAKISIGRFPSAARAVYQPVRVAPEKESSEEMTQLKQNVKRFFRSHQKEMSEVRAKLKEMSQTLIEQANQIRELTSQLKTGEPATVPVAKSAATIEAKVKKRAKDDKNHHQNDQKAGVRQGKEVKRHTAAAGAGTVQRVTRQSSKRKSEETEEPIQRSSKSRKTSCRT